MATNILVLTEFNSVLNRLADMTTANVDSMQVHHNTYVSQIKDAMNVNGGDIENATTSDYVMHFLTFGWKVSSTGYGLMDRYFISVSHIIIDRHLTAFIRPGSSTRHLGRMVIIFRFACRYWRLDCHRRRSGQYFWMPCRS